MERARLREVLLLLVFVGCGRTPLDPKGGTGGAISPPGMPCSSEQDCREDEFCCDGSTPGCDITRLPTGDKTDPGQLAYAGDDLTVSDTVTGLTWQRDLVAERPGCSGSNGSCTWSEALGYCGSLTLNGLSGWRLPGRMEVLTIVDFTKVSPAVDSRAFPMLPNGIDFWTAFPHTSRRGWAWDVSFESGRTRTDDGGRTKKVRCVRGARCVPKTRFAVLGGGLAQDRLTGLVWQQQISELDMTWTQAQSYCPSVAPGLRLPTVRELASLIELTMPSPGTVIDSTAFPSIPESPDTGFWASTPYAIPGGAAWMVYLGGDAGTAVEKLEHHFRVWCVR